MNIDLSKKPLQTFLILILVIAAIIRFATIQYGTNVDEGVYWSEGKQMYDGYVMYRDSQFNKTPFVGLVAAFFFNFGDTPIYLMRVTMILASLLALYVIYRLGVELFGVAAGLFALTFMALEPFTAVWAKYLHTSSWTPWYEAAIYWFLLVGFRQQDWKRLFLSGFVLGIFALTKQTAIYVLPVALLGWFLFSSRKNLRGFLVEGGVWLAGILLLWIPFLLYIFTVAGFSNFWFDIWTAHHLMADAFAHHTFLFRWHDWLSIFFLAPLLWVLPLGALVLFQGKYFKPAMFVWGWLIVEILGNVVLISHVWRHYYLAVMLPAALLAGAFLQWLLEMAFHRRILKGAVNSQVWVYGFLTLLIIGMMLTYPRNDWRYPGLTLEEERILAKHIARYNKTGYLLNLTNPAFYVWLDREVPPAYQGERMTRMPYFMTIAGRGYVQPEDMVRTVKFWETLPLDTVIAYDKFLQQIVDDPLMEPLEQWLTRDFKPPQRVAMGESYYGWFWLFHHRETEKMEKSE